MLLIAGCMYGIPFLFYSCMELSQNIAYRFQYPLVLIMFVLGAYAARGIARRWLFPAAAALSLVLLAPFSVVEGLRTFNMPSENVPYISRKLAALPYKGTIATTVELTEFLDIFDIFTTIRPQKA